MKVVSFFKTYAFYFLIFILISALFILFQPSILSSWSTQNQEQRWQVFVQHLQTQKRMDTKAFWEMREFYSPGSFMFNRQGFPHDQQSELFTSLNLPTTLDQESRIVLHYEAPRFISFESLVSTKSAVAFSDAKATLMSRYPVTVQGDNYVIVKKDKETSIILFLANVNEMERANGFFDYKDKDLQLLKHVLWLDISEVTTR
jgi:hypothetical protein